MPIRISASRPSASLTAPPALAAALILGAAPAAQAVVLYDGGPMDSNSPITNQDFEAAYDSFDIYVVDDVSFAQDVIVNAVSSVFQFQAAVAGPIDFHVLIFDGSEPLDAADDPASLGEWGVTASGALTHVTGGIYDVSVGDLSIALAAGDYFIGLTPVYPFSSGGQSYQFTSTATEGDSWFIRNPGDGFGTGSAWYSGTAYTGYEKHDMVMTIEGEVAAPAVPLPAPALLLGAGVLALAGAARRRVSRA